MCQFKTWVERVCKGALKLFPSRLYRSKTVESKVDLLHLKPGAVPLHCVTDGMRIFVISISKFIKYFVIL